MRPQIIVLLALLGASHAVAAEPVGCDGFKWPVTRERAALTQAELPQAAPGAELKWASPLAVNLDLQPASEAKLPSPPERAAKPDTFAAYVTSQIPAKGTYSISLSAGAWIDVLQNGAFLKPKAFSGATGCERLRKTMTFELQSGSVVIQISGVAEPSVRLAVLSASE